MAERLEKGYYQNIGFWYDIEITDRGIRVSEIWLKAEEIPAKYTDVFKKLMPHIFFHWENIEIALPDWLDKTTLLAFGQVHRDTLYQQREKLVNNQQNRQAEGRKRAEQKKSEFAEQARIVAEQRHIATIIKWRDNPKGIRNEESFRYICLQCGSNDVEPGRNRTNPVCRKCGTTWYVNHCWSCKSGRIDSRDFETPKCVVCTWHKCAFCGACHQNGCSTTRYSRVFRYIDDPSPVSSSSYDRERQDELRASAAGYGFDLNSDDVSYDEEMGMFFDGDHWYPV